MLWLLLALSMLDVPSVLWYLLTRQPLTQLDIVLGSTSNVVVLLFAGYFAYSEKTFKGHGWHYVVTNKRILFLHPADGELTVEQIAITRLTKVYPKLISSPVCTLVFERKLFWGLSERIDFHVSDVAEVQELVVSVMGQVDK